MLSHLAGEGVSTARKKQQWVPGLRVHQTTEERPCQQASSFSPKSVPDKAETPRACFLPGTPEPGLGDGGGGRPFPTPRPTPRAGLSPLLAADRARKKARVTHDSRPFSLAFRTVLFKRNQFIFYSKSIRNN